VGANEKVPDDLPNPSICSPKAGMDPPTLSPRGMEDVPTPSQTLRADQPDVPSGETSERKLPIRSLRDGLLGCPLEALQALAPENYLRRPGAGRTSPERFADIIVHHQIEVCIHTLIFVKFFSAVAFSNSLTFSSCLSMR
jgi:hypothetical protein